MSSADGCSCCSRSPSLSLLAAALTPVGPRLYSAVLLVGGRAKFHDEWASTDFHDAPALVAAGLILVTLVVWVRGGAGQRPAWTPLLLLLLADCLERLLHPHGPGRGDGHGPPGRRGPPDA